MDKDCWNPTQYEKFKAERAQPFHDLLSLIDRTKPFTKITDLGCGTGELTKILHETLQAKETIGTDNSPAMLEKANANTGPGLGFHEEDLQQFSSNNEYDLVFS